MKVIITGAPGAGKSSIVTELKKRGFKCLEEENRVLIKELLATNSPFLPWLNPSEFGNLLLKRQIKQYLSAPKDLCFIDRSFIDITGYFRLAQIKINSDFLSAIKKYRFFKLVFFAEPWREIYHTDSERKESFEESIKIAESIKQSYLEAGYEIVSLPNLSVSKRVDFILNTLKI